ncbi:hypothetical protein [Glutamicibacter uratoxydans]
MRNLTRFVYDTILFLAITATFVTVGATIQAFCAAIGAPIYP